MCKRIGLQSINNLIYVLWLFLVSIYIVPKIDNKGKHNMDKSGINTVINTYVKYNIVRKYEMVQKSRICFMRWSFYYITTSPLLNRSTVMQQLL